MRRYKMRVFTVFSLLIIYLGLLSSCTVTSKVWKPYDKILINTAKDVNQDANGQASPIQIKIYELSSRSTFDNLNFERAFYDAKTFLSDELLSEYDFTLQPKETLEHTINLQKTAKYVAILAGYIDIDNARWKHTYTVKSKSYQSHKITLNTLHIEAGHLDENEEENFNLKDTQQKLDTLDETATQVNNIKGLTH